jgi:hypothetical protein
LSAGRQNRTDTAGRYRIDGVWPGTYGVAVISPVVDGFAQGGGANQAFAGFPTTFYPSAASVEGASLFALSAGEERRDIDFKLTTSSLVSVAGTIEGFPADARSPFVELSPADSQGLQTHVLVAKAAVRPDGGFRFPRVRPGFYVLRTVIFPRAAGAPDARAITQDVTPLGFTMVGGTSDAAVAPLPAAPTLWGTLPLAVPNGDVSGITMRLRPAASIRGHVEFLGQSPRPTADQLLRTVVAIWGVEPRELRSVPAARIEADGQFAIAGLPPGRYNILPLTGSFLHTGGWDPVWKQESIRIGDSRIGAIDLADTDVTNIVITFSDSPRSTELSGIVRDSSGRARPDATIYVFPAGQKDWVGGALREVRPGRSGRYSVSMLPPGDYFIAAVIDEATELWREIEFLEKLSGSASRVTMAAAESKVVNLTIR